MSGVSPGTRRWRAASWRRRLLDLPLHPLLVAGALLAVVVALNLYAPAQPTLLQRGLASLLIGLCAIPSLMWASNRHWPHALLPHAGVLYAACFALPIFLLHDLSGQWASASPFDDAAVATALLLALGGWAALLTGHFVVPTGWLARILPRIEVVPMSPPAREARHTPSRTVRLAKMVAAAAAIVGVPCFYLDKTAVLGHFAGRAVLPDAVAFPVAFAGQAVVFAVLVLFHLHMRGQLAAAGRTCLILLTAYYTLLGFGTGMVNHGLKALFALFAAYAIVARRPALGHVAWAALTAGFLVLVVLPSRYDYRQLVWTHGVEPAGLRAGLGHEFKMEPSAGVARARAVREGTTFARKEPSAGVREGVPLARREPSGQVVETPAYRAVLDERVLAFAHYDATTCTGRPPKPAFQVFLHVHPVDLNDLPHQRRLYGFEQLDFSLQGGTVAAGHCVHKVPLPDFPIRAVRVGLYRFARPPDAQSDLPGRFELTAMAADAESLLATGGFGGWHLATRNAATWAIAPSSSQHSRLLVAVADAKQRRQMAMTGANNYIRVEADARNWAEYVVSTLRISGQLATYRLSELRRWQGDPSALTAGAAATLRYERAGPIVAVLPWPGQRPEGTNPEAPWASRHLASNAIAFASLLPLVVGTAAEGRYDSIVRRFDRLLPVARIMANTPSPVPYLRGETLRPLLYKLVPRAVFKDKPADAVGLIDRRHGFVRPEEQTRHFKVHQIGELYANFGIAGVIVGMVVLGLLLRAIHHMCHHPSATAVTMAAGTHMLVVLVLEMESILSVSWGFVAWYAVALGALAIALRAYRHVAHSFASA